jgi:hypothetical protein
MHSIRIDFKFETMCDNDKLNFVLVIVIMMIEQEQLMWTCKSIRMRKNIRRLVWNDSLIVQ